VPELPFPLSWSPAPESWACKEGVPRLVHLPIHASRLNQIEVYFSIVQRKVVTPNDFYDLTDVEDRLTAFEEHYNLAARPFNWRYTKKDLDQLLERLPAPEPLPTTA
jgi:hypothetical protein